MNRSHECVGDDCEKCKNALGENIINEINGFVEEQTISIMKKIHSYDMNMIESLNFITNIVANLLIISIKCIIEAYNISDFDKKFIYTNCIKSVNELLRRYNKDFSQIYN